MERRTVWEVWDLVGGLLERAHLVNHAADPDGDTDPLNYALLCRRCHRAMSADYFDREDYEAAISWVIGREPCPSWWQLLTDSPEVLAPLNHLNNAEKARALEDIRDRVMERFNG